MLDSNSSMQDMAKEPFSIRLLVGIMPDIRDKLKTRSKDIKVTMFEVMEIFINNWIKNEISRLNREDKNDVAERIADIDYNDLEKQIDYVVDRVN